MQALPEPLGVQHMQILAVVVLYKTSLEDSTTIQRLNDEFALSPDLRNNIKVLLWDNSPDPICFESGAKGLFEYKHSKANLGVSGAYNGAMAYAIECGYEWMLLLDQDTEIKAGFLRTMMHHWRDLDKQCEIAAIAPTVFVRGFVVSPRQQLFNHHRPYPAGQIGVAPGEAFAINSGCLVRVAALDEIGGFSADFWLDYSDMYVFHQFYLHGKKIWRAADAELEHDMSIMDYDRLMTPSRYRNFSYAESAFNDMYKGPIENAVQTMRIFVRAIRQRRKYRNPEFSRIAWEQLIYRLRVPRAERMARWFVESKKRNAALAAGEDETGGAVLQ